MQDNQIHGECQLKELVKSIKFYIEIFDELKRYKKKEKVNELEEKTRKMNERLMI